MHAWSVSVDIAIDSRHGHRRVAAALPRDAAGGLDPSTIVIAIHGELDLCKHALAARSEAAGEALVEPRFYGEAELAGWPGWPMRLGRDPAVPSGAPLADQLAALRARRAARRHLRIAIVGGFGGNLGDALLGVTALRAAMPTLAGNLPSFAADLLLGPEANPAIAGLMAREPGVGHVSFMPPTLEDFSRYDAFFDFAGLITLPRFHDMAALDWILWWMGLDPTVVPASAKRNRLRLPAPSLAWARARLAAISGPETEGPKIAFVWRASVRLRSMPDDIAAAFARDLLDAAPGITLIVDQPLALEHPRLITIPATSAFDMMALVTAVDGLVTIDSLAPHVADAADVPTVMILASLPPSRFPFYPNMAIVTPPGADALPGWGLTKVKDEAWPAVAADYARAWAGVSAAQCWRLLAERIDARAPSGGRLMVEATPSDEGPTAAAGTLPYDRQAPLDRWIGNEIVHLAAGLTRGRTAVLAGGDAALALRLARMVGREGALHVMEPRRLRAQALAAAAQAQGILSLHVHPAIAGTDAGSRRIAALDPASEADPAAWGNLRGTVEVAVTPLDDLNLPACDLAAIRPPHAWDEVLAGAPLLFMAARPLLLIGPIAAHEHDGLRDALALFGYAAGLSAPADRTAADGALVLAAPSEANVRMQGFTPLLD